MYAKKDGWENDSNGHDGHKDHGDSKEPWEKDHNDHGGMYAKEDALWARKSDGPNNYVSSNEVNDWVWGGVGYYAFDLDM